mgnify:FL=1
MCFSCKKKSENEAPCFWSLVGLVWSKPARPTRLRKASCLLPALRPKGKFYFLILFFVLCGIWKSVKRLCLNWEFILWAFPYDLHFFLMEKSLIPKNFWYGSRMTMRKIEILLLAKVELIVYLFISMNQSYSCWLAQLFWEHLFLMWISYKYIPRSCRFSGKKYNHVPKMNASHHYGNWSLAKEENECTIEGITPHWVRQAFDLAVFDFVKLKAFLTRLGVIPTMVTWLTS